MKSRNKPLKLHSRKVNRSYEKKPSQSHHSYITHTHHLIRPNVDRTHVAIASIFMATVVHIEHCVAFYGSPKTDMLFPFQIYINRMVWKRKNKSFSSGQSKFQLNIVLRNLSIFQRTNISECTFKRICVCITFFFFL